MAKEQSIPPIEIFRHAPGEDLSDFISFPKRLYRGDRGWVAPLDMELRDRLNPKKNPFFLHAEAMLFTARRQNEIVGRCSASIDRAHLERYSDDTGFFGFFDTIDDVDVARALIDAARAWLREKGIAYMRGPISLSINEELGLLVDGFSEPSVLMMPYHRPYQHTLLEQVGLQKCKELYAWRYQVGEIPERALRAHANIKGMPEIRIRTLRKSDIYNEVKTVAEIFNDAWSNNWGFVPWTAEELRKVGEDFKLVLVEDLAHIAELNGRPVAFSVALPNINEAIHDIDGKLFPLGLFKLLWRLKVRGPKSARLPLLGIRKELRSVRRYAGLSLALYVEMALAGRRLGYDWGELSWTLEDNHRVNLGIRSMGGEIYKKYRVYETTVRA